jgi:small-conductance mechanosensitive channel
VNGKTQTQDVKVETDPRFKLDPQAMDAQLKMSLELRDQVSALNEALNRLNSLHKQLTNLQDLLTGDESQAGEVNATYKPVLDEARALDKKITSIQNPLYNSDIQPGSQDDVHYLQRFHDRVQSLMRGVMGAYGEAPRDIQLEEAAEVRKELDHQLQQFNTFLNTEVSAFNKKAMEHGSSTLFAGGPVEIKAGAGASGSGTGELEDDDPDQ